MSANTAQKKFSIEDFFSKCDQILSFSLYWSRLMKESWMENSIFVQLSSVKLYAPSDVNENDLLHRMH